MGRHGDAATGGAPMTLEALFGAVRAAEERLEADLHLVLFADGSGDVMTPEWAPPGYEDDEETGDESVYAFDSIEDLMAWLREGELPDE